MAAKKTAAKDQNEGTLTQVQAERKSRGAAANPTKDEVSKVTTPAATPAKAVDPKLEKYPALSASFFRGSFDGQLNSAYKDREANPDKAKQYIDALKAGDVSLPESGRVTRSQADKLTSLGMEVPADIIDDVQRGRKAGEGSSAAAPKAPANPDYPALTGTFLRGKFSGQLKSAHGDMASNPAKALDYAKALVAGVVPAPEGKATAKEVQMLHDLADATKVDLAAFLS